MIEDEIKKHQLFIEHVTEYIDECLKNNVTPDDILKSFKNFIDDAVKKKKE